MCGETGPEGADAAETAGLLEQMTRQPGESIVRRRDPRKRGKKC